MKTGAGRKLGRKSGARRGLLRSLATELLRHEQLITTVSKAKECSRITNHIISIAKKNDLNARKRVVGDIQDREVVKKLFDVLIHRYNTRVGGCTRIFRLERRQGDNAEMALIKLIA